MASIRMLGAAVLFVAVCACDSPTDTGTRQGGAGLVFATFDLGTGTWGIGTADADGENSQRLAVSMENPGDYPDIAIQYVRWSADGERIVYRASNTNTDNWYLVVASRTGSSRRVLTHLGGYAERPRWSPRGDRILYEWGGFVGGSAGTAVQTALVDTLGNSVDFFIADDGEPFEGQRVYFSLLAWPDSSGTVPALYDAQWAADGEHLLVVGTIGRPAWDPALEAKDIELFRVEVSTGRVVERVTHNDVTEWRFRVSPDEQQLLLTLWNSSALVEGEYLMPIDGGAADQVRIIVPPYGVDAEWSNAGGKVTFTRPEGTGGYSRIYIYDTTMRRARATAAEGYWPHLYVKPTP
jgi:hypothetical protein